MGKHHSLFVDGEDSDESPKKSIPFDQSTDSSEAGSIYEPDDLPAKKEEEDFEDEDLTLLHCHCRTPSSGLMIYCDGPCATWYHASCLSLRDSDIADIKAYFCESCTDEGHGPTMWNVGVQAASNIARRVKKERAGNSNVGALNEWVTRSTYGTTNAVSKHGTSEKGIARALPINERRHRETRRERRSTPRLFSSISERRTAKDLAIRTAVSQRKSTEGRTYDLQSRAANDAFTGTPIGLKRVSDRNDTTDSPVGVSSQVILDAALAAGTPLSATAKKRKQAAERKRVKALKPIVYSANGVDVDRPGMKRDVEPMEVDVEGGQEEENPTFADLLVKEAMETALFGAVASIEDFA